MQAEEQFGGAGLAASHQVSHLVVCLDHIRQSDSGRGYAANCGHARGLDGEIKAPPTVALIVVVGVEVKETSQESACCRFCETQTKSIFRATARFYARFRLNVKPSGNVSRRWLCTSAVLASVTVNAARASRRISWPACDEWAGPAPPRQVSRCSRPRLRRLAGLTGWPRPGEGCSRR